MRFVAEVRKMLADTAMLKKGDRVLIGLSGGGDSVALVDVLARLSPQMGFEIGAAHLNHGLRQEARAEARWVARWVTRFDIPFFSDTQPVGDPSRKGHGSVEERAREIRYGYLQRVARNQGFSHIALGHHQDDNAESVLMFLLRGAGPEGLRGIPPVASFPSGGAVVIRPLWAIRRSQIESYLQSRRLSKIDDPSNRDPIFTRNRIRHHLMPLLERDYNPRIQEALNRLAVILAGESSWLDPIIRRQLAYLARPLSSEGLEMAVYALKSLPEGLLRRVLRRAICTVKGDLRRIAYDHITQILRLLAERPQPTSVDLPGRIRCRRVGPTLTICPIASQERHRQTVASPAPRAGDSAAGYVYRVPAPREGRPTRVFVPEIGCRFVFSSLPARTLPSMYRPGQLRAWFDMDKIHFPLKIRSVHSGDRFQRPGGGPGRKIRQLLHNHHIPPDSRAIYPLVLSGTQVLWLVGLAAGETGRPGLDSRKLLRVDCVLVS